jgi:hypothetical protein
VTARTPSHITPFSICAPPHHKKTHRSGLGLEAVDESRGVLRYLVPQAVPQAQLVSFLQALEAGADSLGVDDIQASLASLEEVFLNIAKQVCGFVCWGGGECEGALWLA